MTGHGCTKNTINKYMSYLFWLVIAGIAGYAIFWIMDWHDKYPDGE